ncbi:hypothetical protein MC885_010127 [Smutsia gigantea]|nr:hypothetical protein MC885_010127 [Smutsia gigantea]
MDLGGTVMNVKSEQVQRSRCRLITSGQTAGVHALEFATGGRVVNLSGLLGLVALKNCSPDLQQKFTSETITEEELVGLMNKFVEDTKNGVHLEEGWPHMNITSYAVTKLGITVLSRIQARKLSEQRKADKILLNSCCPGWVRTNLGGPHALKSPEEGAETPVYLALLPSDADGPHGQFIMEKKFWAHVVLTAWDAARGQTAVQQLQAEGLSPRFHLLDICNRQSIRALRDFLLKEYGGLDVLVNNAASPSRVRKGLGALRMGWEVTLNTPTRMGWICPGIAAMGLLRPWGPEWLPREGGEEGLGDRCG